MHLSMYFRSGWSELRKLEAIIIGQSRQEETREKERKSCLFADKQTLETELPLRSNIKLNKE